LNRHVEHAEIKLLDLRVAHVPKLFFLREARLEAFGVACWKSACFFEGVCALLGGHIDMSRIRVGLGRVLASSLLQIRVQIIVSITSLHFGRSSLRGGDSVVVGLRGYGGIESYCAVGCAVGGTVGTDTATTTGQAGTPAALCEGRNGWRGSLGT
jgi:hypothetical protein